MTWSRHLRILLTTFIGLNAALYLFVLAMNPYGNLPNSVFSSHAMMDDNQRYQYPSVVRSGRYDSLIIGTSTSRLLDPKPFAAVLGGRFANLAMNSGTAWEQTELTRLFLKHQPIPHALVVGIDTVWCSQNAGVERITFRGFPEWMYDDDKWNDFAYMYNSRSVEISGRRLGAALTGRGPRLPPDGWEVFTPPEKDWDLAKVQAKLYGDGQRLLPLPKVPPETMSAPERSALRFPALDWLDKLIAEGKWQRVVLLFPPVHLIAQPQPGSRAALIEAECKSRIAAIGAGHKAPVIDFRINSEITMRDTNFWDPLHYRVPIAERVAAGVARALEGARNSPDGDWRILKPAE